MGRTAGHSNPPPPLCRGARRAPGGLPPERLRAHAVRPYEGYAGVWQTSSEHPGEWKAGRGLRRWKANRPNPFGERGRLALDFFFSEGERPRSQGVCHRGRIGSR
jgi:hypothetical protein